MIVPNSRKNSIFSEPAPKGAGRIHKLQVSRGERPGAPRVGSPQDCLVGSDMEGTIVSWSGGAERLFGYTAQEMIGKHIDKLLTSNDGREIDLAVGASKPAGKVDRFESRRVCKDGTPIEVSVQLMPVMDASGRLCGFSSNYRKIGKVAPESPKAASVASEAVSTGSIPPRTVNPRRALLGTAGAGGTIAAVRLLNAKGFDTGVIRSETLATAAWSNAAKRSYSGPPESDGARFLEWLMGIGAADPGQVLLPTSDQTSWLYTLNAEALGRHFRMYQPSIETMRRILDKKMFSDAVVRAGLSVLPSWEPRNADELRTLARTLPYPILIKPRTHVHRLRNDKGLVVHSEAEMIDQFRYYLNRESVRAADNPHLPEAGFPLLQQFVDVSKEGVYSVSGFIDRSGEHFVTRRSVKVFQRSVPVGVGICFESRPAAPALSAQVRALCRELGYFGLFEVEFIRFGDKWAAIDFNPRMFNQLGMDILRGMPLPLFACLDALDDKAALREAVAQAQAVDEDKKAVFCDRFTFRSILLAKLATGRISRTELSYWRNWLKQNRPNAADFALDPDDKLPGWIHALSEINLGLRAIPKFLRLTPRTSPEMEPAFTKVQS